MEGNLGKIPIRLLAVSGGPRKRGNTELLLEAAIRGATDVGSTDIVKYYFSGKHVAPCTHCDACKKLRSCVVKDDFQEFEEAWLSADAILYSVAVYHQGIPAQFKAALDRLGHVSGANEKQRSRFNKSVGILVQGNSLYGGQEMTFWQVAVHALLMNCVIVPGEKPRAKLGVMGTIGGRGKGGIIEDKFAMEEAVVLGKRVAEMAKILQVGQQALGNELQGGYGVHQWVREY